MWVLDHEADIESDLSAFHRIDDPTTLDGPRFFRLAHRLGAYAGVMQARIVEAKEAEKAHSAPSTTSATPGAEKVSRVNDDVALALLATDGWVEHEKGSAPA